MEHACESQTPVSNRAHKPYESRVDPTSACAEPTAEWHQRPRPELNRDVHRFAGGALHRERHKVTDHLAEVAGQLGELEQERDETIRRVSAWGIEWSSRRIGGIVGRSHRFVQRIIKQDPAAAGADDGR